MLRKETVAICFKIRIKHATVGLYPRPTGCIMPPVAKFVKYASTINITHISGRLVYHIL